MSTQKKPLLTLAIAATAALTANRAATLAGAVPAAGAAATGGVCTRDTAIGGIAPCDVLGTTTMEAGAAVAAGVQLDLDASGRAITHAAGVIIGRALQAAAAAGDLIEVLLLPT